LWTISVTITSNSLVRQIVLCRSQCAQFNWIRVVWQVGTCHISSTTWLVKSSKSRATLTRVIRLSDEFRISMRLRQIGEASVEFCSCLKGAVISLSRTSTLLNHINQMVKNERRERRTNVKRTIKKYFLNLKWDHKKHSGSILITLQRVQFLFDYQLDSKTKNFFKILISQIFYLIIWKGKKVLWFSWK